jgi:hypothetical protein
MHERGADPKAGLMEDRWLPALAIVAVGVPAAMLLEGYLNAFLSGWFRLARTYRDRTGFGVGAAFEDQVVRMRWNEYPATIATDSAGVHVRTRRFRFGHPPLYVPWEQVEPCGYVEMWSRGYDAYRLAGKATLLIPAGSPASPLRRPAAPVTQE